ncbi:MAG: hypothetical protein ACRBB3_09715 [Alphaproteobacteria bacterium]
MADKESTNTELSKAFSAIPNETTRFGVWEGENDVQRFIKVIESSTSLSTSSSMPWIPRSITEYDFTQSLWEPKEDLMQMINSSEFMFFDSPQDCQKAMIEHVNERLKSTVITPIQELDGA